MNRATDPSEGMLITLPKPESKGGCATVSTFSILDSGKKQKNVN